MTQRDPGSGRPPRPVHCRSPLSLAHLPAVALGSTCVSCHPECQTQEPWPCPPCEIVTRKMCPPGNATHQGWASDGQKAAQLPTAPAQDSRGWRGPPARACLLLCTEGGGRPGLDQAHGTVPAFRAPPRARHQESLLGVPRVLGEELSRCKLQAWERPPAGFSPTLPSASCPGGTGAVSRSSPCGGKRIPHHKSLTHGGMLAVRGCVRLAPHSGCRQRRSVHAWWTELPSRRLVCVSSVCNHRL